MSKPRLSVTIITLNEEGSIARAIKSVQKLADEVVVVDSGSADKTVQVAKKLGAKVYTREFPGNFADQKNYAAEKTTGDWILSLDADEVAEEELVKEINEAIERDDFDAYLVPRKNYILGKFIKYTRWQPELDRHVWLWKRGTGEWGGKVHEEFVSKGKVGKLKAAKRHYQYETVSEFFEMINSYSSLEAEKRLKEGATLNYFRLFFEPLYNFSVRYFYRLGFLDGWRGFILSYLMAIYHFTIWIKIWEAKK